MAGTSSGRSVDVKSGTPDTPTTTNKSTSQPKPRKKLSPAEKTAMAALATLIEDIAAHKSKAAFKKLFEYFAPRLKGYLMRLGSSEAQAEELVQDVMLTVWRRLRFSIAARLPLQHGCSPSRVTGGLIF